jgi:glutamyl-tRNA synthetase
MTKSNPPVVTRFAPSPTGAMHVGNARTALQSWAYARGRGGPGSKFILRFEDTDQKRSSKQAEDAILRDLEWLGLDYDEGPYRQSERLDIYNEHIDKLMNMGVAYVPDDEPDIVRFKMERDIAFDDAAYGHIKVAAADLEDFVIRKSDGFPTFHLAVVIDDALMGVTHIIRGQEHLSNTPKHVALQDALGFARPTYVHTPSIMNKDGSKVSKRDKAKVARKAALDHIQQTGDREAWIQQLVQIDRTPTDMLPTHLRRHRGLFQNVATLFGVEDINSFLNGFLDKENDEVAIACLIADVLHIDLPEINIADFRDSGYLPQVLCNYIALLGWNPGGDVEQFDMAFLCERFDIDRIGKKNAQFDRQKLFRFNADEIAAMPPDEFRTTLYKFSDGLLNQFPAGPEDTLFIKFCEAYQPRSRTLREPEQLGAFFFSDAFEYDDKAVKKTLQKNDGEGIAALRELRDQLAAIDPWSGETAHDLIKSLSESTGKGMGQFAQPLRVAVSGSTVTPPIDVTLDMLGKDETLKRIDRCLNTLGG